ncbi:hypothetical protein RB195_018635 [Necator americanus]|uniref:Secreted protein n=1 Tax=Necator americanus TaxID=51031 RepID=A0ABR1CDM0_NECAM
MWFVKRAFMTVSSLETISRAFAASSKEFALVTNSAVATGVAGMAGIEAETILSIRVISSEELRVIDGDVKTASSFSIESLGQHSSASTCASHSPTEIHHSCE